MMTKMKKKLLYILIFTASSLIFSCGDDSSEEETGRDIDNGTNTEVVSSKEHLTGILDKNTGLRLRRVMDCFYEYGDDGLIQKFRINDTYGYYCMFNHPSNTLYESYNSGFMITQFRIIGGAVDLEYSVKYNDKGYISSLQASNGTYFSINYSFSYDNKEHLISWTANCWMNYEDELVGESHLSSIFTWNGNRLISTSYDVSDKSGRTSGYAKYESKFSYDNNAIDKYNNKYAQYAPSIFAHEKDIIKDLMEELSYVGLLGKGPDVLPSGVEKKLILNPTGLNEAEYFNPYTFSYIFNSDGSIASSEVNSEGKKKLYYDYKK